MNVTQASREIGIGRKVLQRLAEVEGFRFRDGRDDGVINLTLSNLGAATCERHIERLRSLQAIGLSERSALRTCGLGGLMFKALCQRGGITWPAKDPRQGARKAPSNARPKPPSAAARRESRIYACRHRPAPANSWPTSWPGTASAAWPRP